MLTDQELREGLRALGAEPPPAPVERVASSMRRARVIRTRRLAAVAAVVAAVTVPAALVVPGLRAAHPTDVTSPASWPDRRALGMHVHAGRAFAEWDSHNDLRPGERVRWIYAGQVPGTTQVAVAFATCTDDVCSRLVLLGSVPNRPADWRDVTRELSPYATLGPPAMFFDTPASDHGPGNFVFVLPPPGTERVTFQSDAKLPGAGGRGDLPAVGNGAFAGGIGYVSSTVTVTAYDRNGEVIESGPVGAAGGGTAIGNPPLVDAVEPVAGYEIVASVRGVANSTQLEVPDVATYFVFYRCVSGNRPMAIVERDLETVTCDGRTRRLGSERRGRNVVGVRIFSEDPYATVALAIAVPR